MTPTRHILWVDDEIEMLRPHQIFLERKGYKVSTANNGDDAIALVSDQHYDLVLLDEMMPGKDGLTTLNEIKNIRQNLPVVMVTKSEAEDVMEQAIGQRIDGYLIKPVQPMQILSICKQMLDQTNIREKQVTPEYVQQFNELNSQIMSGIGWREWVTVFQQLVRWDRELDAISAQGLQATQADLKREANQEFANYIRDTYPAWMKGNDAPCLSPHVFSEFVKPHLQQKKSVFFILIDCMRLDQWRAIAPQLSPYFSMHTDYYYSILPTATPYSRNAVFSGLFPDQIAEQFPNFWQERSSDESSRNQFEEQLLIEQVKRLRLTDPERVRYHKITTHDEMLNFQKKLDSCLDQNLTALVVNFLDILTHGRSESPILRELAPDETAFRTLMTTWFQHSVLLEILKALARTNTTVVITSDHGAVMSNRSTKVIGDRDTSTNLRYKFGVNLQCDQKVVIRLTKPEMYRLPNDFLNKNYLIATHDYYFVYPTNYHQYQRYYAGSFQHGGVSLEEMILPVVTLTPLR